MAYQNLPQMFLTRAEQLAGAPRYRCHRDGRWAEVTWTECAERVTAVAAALVGMGVSPGDRVALLCSTRPEWMEADLGILAAGAVTVPIYPSSLAEECGYILWNAGATVAFVENEAQEAKIRQALAAGLHIDGEAMALPPVRLLRIDGSAEGSFPALIERGRREWPARRAEIERRIAGVRTDDLATIVYTSGTTGPPKGVMQTHGNHLAAVESAVNVGLIHPGEVDFFFLPLAHSFARMVEYLGLRVGTVTAFARSIDTLLDDLRDTRPHLIPAVPRVYEKIHGRILARREAASGLRRALMDWAFRVGRERSERVRRREPVPPLLALQDRLADRLVFSRIRAVLGGRVRAAVSGGAPLAREIAEFFHSVGLLLLEGYGLTETTPILTCNRPDAYRFGTVGRAVDGVTLRIADDGEILARGPNVAVGYYRRPEATAEAWDADGWFHTGDIGEIDADGFLRITDRKKDLIKTSGGKYVAPQAIENLLKMQPHISHAVVVGDNRKYCVVLLTLDAEAMERWARSKGVALPERNLWPRDEAIRSLIDGEVGAVNRQLPSYSTLKHFRILPQELTQEGGELTPSLKVKRKVVIARHADLVEEMYR